MKNKHTPVEIILILLVLALTILFPQQGLAEELPEAVWPDFNALVEKELANIDAEKLMADIDWNPKERIITLTFHPRQDGTYPLLKDLPDTGIWQALSDLFNEHLKVTDILFQNSSKIASYVVLENVSYSEVLGTTARNIREDFLNHTLKEHGFDKDTVTTDQLAGENFILIVYKIYPEATEIKHDDMLVIKIKKPYADDDPMVAAIGAKKYRTLKEALDSVQNGDVVNVLSDSAGVGIDFPSGKQFTVDFHNHTYTHNCVPNAGLEVEYPTSFYVPEDSTVTLKNGTLINEEKKYVSRQLLINRGNLTLEHMVLQDGKPSLVAQSGTVLIDNSSIIAMEYGKIAIDFGFYSGYMPSSANVLMQGESCINGDIVLTTGSGHNPTMTINSGTVMGRFLVPEDLNHIRDYKHTQTSITGGFFSNDPSRYVASGYHALKKDTGWTVEYGNGHQSNIEPNDVELGKAIKRDNELITLTSDTKYGSFIAIGTREALNGATHVKVTKVGHNKIDIRFYKNNHEVFTKDYVKIIFPAPTGIGESYRAKVDDVYTTFAQSNGNLEIVLRPTGNVKMRQLTSEVDGKVCIVEGTQNALNGAVSLSVVKRANNLYDCVLLDQFNRPLATNGYVWVKLPVPDGIKPPFRLKVGGIVTTYEEQDNLLSFAMQFNK